MSGEEGLRILAQRYSGYWIHARLNSEEETAAAAADASSFFGCFAVALRCGAHSFAAQETAVGSGPRNADKKVRRESYRNVGNSENLQPYLYRSRNLRNSDPQLGQYPAIS